MNHRRSCTSAVGRAARGDVAVFSFGSPHMPRTYAVSITRCSHSKAWTVPELLRDPFTAPDAPCKHGFMVCTYGEKLRRDALVAVRGERCSECSLPVLLHAATAPGPGDFLLVAANVRSRFSLCNFVSGDIQKSRSPAKQHTGFTSLLSSGFKWQLLKIAAQFSRRVSSTAYDGGRISVASSSIGPRAEEVSSRSPCVVLLRLDVRHVHSTDVPCYKKSSDD